MADNIRSFTEKELENLLLVKHIKGESVGPFTIAEIAAERERREAIKRYKETPEGRWMKFA